MTEAPRLSYSIAKTLLTCPAKAWLEHRLLGGKKKEPTKSMDTGKVLEALITGAEPGVAVIHKDSFRTKEAKEARDAAYADGLTPMLAREYDGLLEAAEQLTPKILRTMGDFSDWQFQQRHEWTAQGCECSGVLDAVDLAGAAYHIVDFKSTADASPDGCERAISRFGYQIQQAAYIDAVETAHPRLAGRGNFTFIFFETVPPYCVLPVQLDGVGKDLGRRKWARAKRVWSACLEADEWPGYAPAGHIHIAETKPWDLSNFTDEPDRDEGGNLTHNDLEHLFQS